jgi:hypothetical protein
MESELIPEVFKCFIRADMGSDKWLIDVCDELGKICARINIQKDLSDLEDGLEAIGSL